jgi:hypothetical protein
MLLMAFWSDLIKCKPRRLSAFMLGEKDNDRDVSNKTVPVHFRKFGVKKSLHHSIIDDAS